MDGIHGHIGDGGTVLIDTDNGFIEGYGEI